MVATVMSQAVMDAICDQLADGHSLRGICEANNMPDRGTVLRALAKNDEWATQYALAKQVGLEAWADDIIDTATRPRIGSKTKVVGKGKTKVTETVTGDMVDRSRLEVDAKKWIMSKLAPKKYGDRLDMTVDAKVEGSVQYQANIPPRRPR